jgi:formylglycine-generating enzyme required for sulfatase activity
MSNQPNRRGQACLTRRLPQQPVGTRHASPAQFSSSSDLSRGATIDLGMDLRVKPEDDGINRHCGPRSAIHLHAFPTHRGETPGSRIKSGMTNLLLGFLLLLFTTSPIHADVEADPSFNSGKLLAEQLQNDGRVKIEYRIRESSGASLNVKLYYSEDETSYTQAQETNLSGDYGNIGAVSSYQTKTLYFDGVKVFPNRALSAKFRLDINPVGQGATGETYTDPNYSIEMIRISAGTFTMGSPSNETDRGSDEGPQHQVTIGSDFYIGKYEVTQGQYGAVMGLNPSNFSSCGTNCPVEYVEWSTITQVGGFLDLLNAAASCDTSNFPTDDTRYRPDNVPSGCYRLPTEAEWEYAARAGTSTNFSYGADSSYSQLGSYGWYTSNSSSKTHPVGEKLPNPWGLYDMHGNVWEWNYDWYDSSYYNNGAQTDPVGATSGSFRVVRGGSWYDYARGLRSAFRYGFSPDYRLNVLGFRLLREP